MDFSFYTSNCFLKLIICFTSRQILTNWPSNPGKDYSMVQSKFWMTKFLSSWKEYIKIEPFSLSLSLSLSLFSNILSYKVVIFHNFKAKHDPSYSVEDFKHFYIERARNNINIERNLLYLLWKKKKRICITGYIR